MTTLGKGANTLVTSGGRVHSWPVLLGVEWPNVATDLDLVALMCGADKRVLGDDHFLFWDQPVGPNKETFLRSVQPGAASPVGDRAQLLINLALMRPSVERIYVALANLTEGGSMAQSGGISLRLVDLTDGAVVADYSNPGTYTTEACVVLTELYRYQGQWKVRAVDQGYAGGLAALGRDHGVNIS